MVNYGFSFGRNVISDVLNKIEVQNTVFLIEDFFDDSNLLGCEVDAKGVEKKIEGMGIHESGILWIELLNVFIAVIEVLEIFAEQLELEFVIDFGELVNPVHFSLG